MLRADGAGEKSGVRKTRPTANSGSSSGSRNANNVSKSTKIAETNSKSSSNNAGNNAVRNNNKTALNVSNVGNNNDSSRFSSRRNVNNAGNNSDAVRNRSIALANSNSVGNSSDSSKSNSRANSNSVGNSSGNSKRSDRIRDVPKTGSATVKTTSDGDNKSYVASRNKSNAIEIATAGSTIAIVTITGIEIATGAESRNSANCVIARSGSDVRMSSISVDGCLNSNDV